MAPHIFSKVSAQSVSASADPAATSDAQTTQKLKDRIDKIIEQRREQVKGVVDDLSQTKRGFVGQVLRVTQTALTLKNDKEQVILNITPAIFLTKDGKKATIDDVAVGDWGIAIGYKTQDFTVKRIILSSHTLLPHTYETLIGTVQNVTRNTVTFLPRGTQTPVTFTINKNTPLQDETDKPLNSYKDITPDVQYLVIDYTDASSQKVVTLLRALVPAADQQSLQPPFATPSAQQNNGQ